MKYCFMIWDGHSIFIVRTKKALKYVLDELYEYKIETMSTEDKKAFETHARVWINRGEQDFQDIWFKKQFFIEEHPPKVT